MLRTSPKWALVALAFANHVWGGREFPQQPGEQVVPDRLLVKLIRGSRPLSVFPGLTAGGQVQNLKLPDHYLVRLPPGVAGGIARLSVSHAHQTGRNRHQGFTAVTSKRDFFSV